MAMATKPVTRIAGALAWLASVPAALVGPIFTKELRVSSRRRRNFALRAVYLAILTAVVTLFWLASVEWDTHGSHAYHVTMMSRAGRIIVLSVVWFQFCGIQIVAIVMLSTAISEEIHHRTLGVLMTTPIRSFQVVVGKLLSKLLQLIVLLGMSLPLLAIVRIFGGVPWEFVVAGLCITLTTAIAVASVAMFFSILFRRAFASILLALGVVVVLHGGVPLIAALLLDALDLDTPGVVLPLLSAWSHVSPYPALTLASAEVLEPRATAALGAFHWWGNCVVSLLFSGGVLAACTAMVRRVALGQIAGATGAGAGAASALQANAPSRRPPTTGAEPPDPPPAPLVVLMPTARAASFAPPVPRARVRPITGSPIVWRELRAGWIKRKLLFRILVGVGAWLLLMIYGLIAAVDNGFRDNDVHAVMVFLFVCLGAIATAVLAATTITAEKEANSWEILLCTTLSSWHILRGKIVGVLRKCLPFWLVPLGHVALFMMVGLAHPVLMVHLALVTASVIGLLAGSGLYFGARLKRTTTAVIANLGLALVLWGALPLALALSTEVLPRGPLRREMWDLTEYVADANPMLQAGMLTDAASGHHRSRRGLQSLRYDWLGVGWTRLGGTTGYLAVFTTGYVALGALLAWRARARFRRGVF